MRVVPILLAIVLALACAPRIPIEGAPCSPRGECPGGYSCVAARCEKINGPPGMEPTRGPMGGGPSAVGADAGLPPVPETCSDPGPAPLRRLTPEEYRNTVLDLTGVQVDESRLPAEFSRLNAVTAPRPGMTAGTLESLMAVAEQVSEQAVTQPWRFVDCADDPGSTRCAENFVGVFGERAFRRRMTADERKLFLQAFEAGRSTAGFTEGLRRVIELALSSPQFLYRFEAGEPRDGAGVTPLTSWELATRLSYLIWVSMPDDGLYRAAWGDYLKTPEQRRQQVEYMLKDPRATRGRISFLERWLDTSAARLVTKPPDIPYFTVELREALITSAHQTFAQRAWEGDQKSLFDSPDIWANADMARFYGLWPPPPGEFAMVRAMGDQKRFGILTYPAILSSQSRGEETSPVARGVLFVEEVLCEELPVPPSNIAAVAPADQRPGATTRERMSEHSDNPGCAACHQLFDPVGLGLENYDGYGVWRTHENGQPINASGRLLGKDFDGPDGLARLLGDHDKVSNCLVKQWFRYVFGRDPLPTDDCTLQQLKGAFVRNGRSLDSLLRATVETEAFRTRTTTGGGGM
jgi:hypothetical protein